MLLSLLGLFFVLEADEAKFPRSLILEHYLGICDLAALLSKMAGKITLFEVLGYIFYY